MVTLTWFSIALALMFGVGGATFGTIVALYDLMFKSFLTDQERSSAYVRIVVAYALALAGAGFIALVGPGLCRGCP